MTNNFSTQNMSTELKFAYVLILISIIGCVAFCKIACCPKRMLDNLNVNGQISDWIKNNPKAVLDSINDYIRKEQESAQQKQQENAKANVKNNYNKLVDEKTAGVQNKDGKKVIVEFFDFNCGYCRLAKKAIDEVAKDDKDVKVIYRDFPIFGGNSEVAARYAIAIAISDPDKYGEFATILFESGADQKSKITEAVTKIGLKLDKIEKVLKDQKSEIDERLKNNRELAVSLGLQGTPAFIIGEEFIPGFVDAATIKSILDKQN